MEYSTVILLCSFQYYFPFSRPSFLPISFRSLLAAIHLFPLFSFLVHAFFPCYVHFLACLCGFLPPGIFFEKTLKKVLTTGKIAVIIGNVSRAQAQQDSGSSAVIGSSATTKKNLKKFKKTY